MALPGQKTQHKIEHICCDNAAGNYKSVNGKHWYRCSGCGETDIDKESRADHKRWRDKHFKSCFVDNTKPGRKARRVVAGTETEMRAAAKQNKIVGRVTYDYNRPRNARYEWREA